MWWGNSVQASLLLAFGCFIPLLALKNRNSSVFGLVVVLIYFLLIRLSPPQLDMIHYLKFLETNVIFSCMANPYYWREPLFWCGAPVVYHYLAPLGVERMTFLLIDVSLVALCFHKLKEHKNRGIILFLLILSLPSFLGINNIYRQWIAMMLVIPALICFLDGRNVASIGWLLLSSLAHNTSLILVAIVLFFILVRRLTPVQKYLLFAIFLFLVLLPLSAVIKQKSGEFMTGLNFAPLLTFIVCTLSIVCYRPIGRIIGLTNSGILSIYISVVTVAVYLSVSSGASERLSFYFIFFYMAAFLILGRVRPTKVFYFLYFLLNFTSIFGSPSTRAIAFNYFT